MDKGTWGKLTAAARPPQPGTPLWQPWRLVTKLNMAIWRASGGRLLGRFDGAPMLVLHHRGAKSGQRRETPLVYLQDGDRIVIVASIGGAPKNPAWFYNVKAHPDVTVELRGRKQRMRARVVDEAERAELWPRLLEIWPAWEDYQARTDRQIPVISLE